MGEGASESAETAVGERAASVAESAVVSVVGVVLPFSVRSLFFSLRVSVRVFVCVVINI